MTDEHRHTRTTPADRRRQILAAAVAEARKHGYTNLTRDGVATAAGVSFPRVTQLFGDMPSLRDEIMHYAVKNADLVILAQGLAHHDPIAQSASAGLKKRAAASLLTAS